MRFARLSTHGLNDIIMIDRGLEAFEGIYRRDGTKKPRVICDLFFACPRVSSIEIPHSGKRSDIGLVVFKRSCPISHDFIPYAVAHIGNHLGNDTFIREVPNVIDLYKKEP